MACRPPQYESQRAASPATQAVANDVPVPLSTLNGSTSPAATRAHQTSSPGAVMSTSGPRPENRQFSPAALVAATATISGRAAGKTVVGALLPAAETMMTPCEWA